jgi:hypothetical protein
MRTYTYIKIFPMPNHDALKAYGEAVAQLHVFNLGTIGRFHSTITLNPEKKVPLYLLEAGPSDRAI